MEHSFVIDNQVVTMVKDKYLVIRRIGVQSLHSEQNGEAFDPAEDYKLEVKSWGSRLIDNQVLTLLATNRMHFDELHTITESTINKRLRKRIV